eukprot:1500823-Amphidinium_carterae.1
MLLCTLALLQVRDGTWNGCLKNRLAYQKLSESAGLTPMIKSLVDGLKTQPLEARGSYKAILLNSAEASKKAVAVATCSGALPPKSFRRGEAPAASKRRMRSNL